MIHLGDAKDLWDAHQKVCGRSHEDFARHLLILHKAYCADYCEANSLQKTVLKALQTERMSHAQKENGGLAQLGGSHQRNNFELKVKEEPAEIVGPALRTPRFSSTTSNVSTTIAKQNGTDAVIEADSHPEELSGSPDGRQSEPCIESYPLPINSDIILRLDVANPCIEAVTSLFDAGLNTTSADQLVTDQCREDLSSLPDSGQQPADNTSSLANNHFSAGGLCSQPDSGQHPSADELFPPPPTPEHQHSQGHCLQSNTGDPGTVLVRQAHTPQLAVTPVSLYTNAGLIAPDHMSHWASGCLKSLAHLTGKNKHVSTHTFCHQLSNNDLLHVMEPTDEVKDSDYKYRDKGLTDCSNDHVSDPKGNQPFDSTQLLQHMVTWQEAVKQQTADVPEGTVQPSVLLEKDNSASLKSNLRTSKGHDPSKSNPSRVFLKIVKKKIKKPPSINVLQKTKMKVCASQDSSVVLKRFRRIAPRLNVHVGASSHVCSDCGVGFRDLCSLKLHMITHSGDTSGIVQNTEMMPCVLPDKYTANTIDILQNTDLKPSVLSSSVLPDSHMNVASGKCVCYYCGKEFLFFAKLQKHMKDHVDQSYTCYKCGKGPFSDPKRLQLHLEFHTQDLSCQHCSKDFSTMPNLLTHLEWHTGQLPHTCCECSKVLCSKHSLHVHMKQHTGHKPHICAECGKGFSTKQILKLHMLTHTGLKDHVCPDCGKGFSELGGLKKHIRTHTGEKPYLCTECNVGFTERCALKKHMVVHIERPYKCADCGKAFSRMDGLKAHLRIHTGEKSYLCSKCGKAFTQSSTLRKHMMIHTGQKPHVCSECGKGFRMVSNLKDHMMTHTGEKPYTCTNCGKRFSQKGKLTIHMRKHTGEKPYKCMECGKVFIESSSKISHMKIHASRQNLCAECGKAFCLLDHLKNHMITHSGENPHVCFDCDQRFSDASKLTSHMRIHRQEKPHICSECGKEFKKFRYLKRHMFTHTGETPYLCLECGKGFRRLDELKIHTVKHTGVKAKPHLCTRCGKGFAVNYALKIHMRTHTGEKPHVCSYCGKGFGLLTILKTHIRTHTGEKPHVCSYCGKGFIASANLKRHLVSHTGEKPYVCSDCSKAFGGLTDLKKHRMIHTGEKPFQCSYCTYASNRKSNLNKHVEIHTGQNTSLIHHYPE